MQKILKFSLLFLLIVVSGSLRAGQVSNDLFEKALVAAIEQVNIPAWDEMQVEDFKGLEYLDGAGTGSYELGLRGYKLKSVGLRNTSGTYTKTIEFITEPGDLENNGTYYTFDFTSAVIPPVVQKEILEDDEFTDYVDYVKKKEHSSTFESHFVNHSYTFSARFDYTDDLDDLVKSLVAVLGFARHSITLIWRARDNYFSDYRENLLDAEVKGSPTNDNFLALLNDDDLYSSEDEEAGGRGWYLNLDKGLIEIVNSTSAMEIGVIAPVYEGLSPEKRNSIIQGMQAFLNEENNKIDGVDNIKVLWDKDDPDYLGGWFIVNYDGKHEGEDFPSVYYLVINVLYDRFIEKLSELEE